MVVRPSAMAVARARSWRRVRSRRDSSRVRSTAFPTCRRASGLSDDRSECSIAALTSWSSGMRWLSRSVARSCSDKMYVSMHPGWVSKVFVALSSSPCSTDACASKMWVSFTRLLSSRLRESMASSWAVSATPGLSGGFSGTVVVSVVGSSSSDSSHCLARVGGQALPISLMACDQTGSNW